jgi:DNA-binding HxlR family transcriptional regulator
MAKLTLTVPTHTDADCPVLDGPARTQYSQAVRAASDFSMACMDFLNGRTPEEKVAWIRTTVTAGREVFQAWSLEILYAVAVLGTARFSDLLQMLGLSSRTLSDKLKALQDGGFVERRVYDERPIRIEYTLSKHGRATAALASPLFARLNLEALKAKTQ